MPLSKKANYNVLVNSVNGTGAVNSQKKYNFDWSVLPQGKYEVRFSFISEVNNCNGLKTAQLHVELGGSKVFTTGTTIAAQTSNLIGNLQPLTIEVALVDAVFRTDTTTNPPVFLDNRPYQQQFEVKVLDENGALYTDGAGLDLAPYILTLSFDLLEDYNFDQRNSSVYNDSEQVINSSRRNGQYGL